MSRIHPHVIDEVMQRAQFTCEACSGPQSWDMVFHHRMARGMGGSKGRDLDVAANLVYIHGLCHQAIHAHPERARELGLIVPSWGDYNETPATPLWSLP